MNKTYYTLLVRFDEFDTWSVQFGDYDRSVVEDELTEYSGGAYAVRIVKTEPGQAAIMAKLRQLNELIEV